MPKEKRNAMELAALIRARLRDASGCTIIVASDPMGWKAYATCRLNNGEAIQLEVDQLSDKLRMFYELTV